MNQQKSAHYPHLLSQEREISLLIHLCLCEHCTSITGLDQPCPVVLHSHHKLIMMRSWKRLWKNTVFGSSVGWFVVVGNSPCRHLGASYLLQTRHQTKEHNWLLPSIKRAYNRIQHSSWTSQAICWSNSWGWPEIHDSYTWSWRVHESTSIYLDIQRTVQGSYHVDWPVSY